MTLPKTYLERNLGGTGGAQQFTNLAIGTHVFLVTSHGQPPAGTNHIHVMAESTGGTVNVAYTFDIGDLTVLATGAAPAQTFPATVNSEVWTTGATADGVERIAGPVTAVQVTIATAAVNKVTITT